jgi:hypothetical protein
MKTIIFNPIVLLVLLCVTTLFYACEIEDSAEVNQDRIYADYEVFYNSNTDKTWVIARFRFGGVAGTLLELKAPANVTFNDDPLPFNSAFNGHFKEYAGQITNGTFRYENVERDVFENVVPNYETIAFPNNSDTISKAQAYSLAWNGTPLAANQRVGVFVGSWAYGQNALFVQNNEGATNIVFGLAQLTRLPLGNSTLFMDRTTEVDVEEGTSRGGKIRSKFRAINQPVIIVE